MNDRLNPLHFDDTLAIFVEAVIAVLGRRAFIHGRALRDVFGRLGFLSGQELDPKKAATLAKRLELALGPWYAAESGLIQPGEFGYERLWDAPTSWERIERPDGEALYVDVVDRRIVGQDWVFKLKEDDEPSVPRMVFWSAKGGVGRSTALCVLAAHLAQNGFNVLVIDADLEAPGLGALLLNRKDRPRWGLIDYLADNGLTGWTDEDMLDFVAASDLTDRLAGQGLVDVVPAVGTATLDRPQNMLAKLSRAMLEEPHDLVAPVPLAGKLRAFVDRMSERRRYDAVLIDARAGLAEIAAGTLSALGATIMVFGVNQDQTFEGYRYLFAPLARLPHADDPDRDWRRRFRFVHSKASAEDEDGAERFRDSLYEVLSEEFYEDSEDEDAFTFSLDDDAAPHAPLAVYFDPVYMRFDPVRQPQLLRKEAFRAAFGEFLAEAQTQLGLPEGAIFL